MNFAQLFAGGTESYTVLRYVPGSNQDGDKLEGRVETIHTAPRQDDYDAHVAGRRSIGIVPIRSDGTVSFVVLDVDVYGMQESLNTAKRVHRVRGNPFIPCLSKSDGLHLFAFFEKPTPATEARKMAAEWIKKLGIKAEIFPKQDTLEDGALGSAINLPYFGEQRFALDIDGAPISLPEFLEMAESLLIRAAAPKKERPRPPQGKFDTGPPCLQSRLDEFPVDENRTDWLFQSAAFFFKKYGDVESMVNELKDLNQERFYRPQDQIEQIGHLQRSFNKKPLGFKCKPDWAAARCQREVCVKRKHGIAGSAYHGFKDQEAEISEVLEMYRNTGSPQYVVSIYDGAVFFENIEEITNLTKFINSVFVATGKNLEWEGKAKDFPDWMRKEMAAKRVVDERSENEFLALEGIVLNKFKAWVKQRVTLDHAKTGEAYVRWWDEKKTIVGAPMVEFLEQIDKMKVALDKKFNRKHINTVLFKFGCELKQHLDDGEWYYVCPAWFEKEDERAQNRPHT